MRDGVVKKFPVDFPVGPVMGGTAAGVGGTAAVNAMSAAAPTVGALKRRRSSSISGNTAAIAAFSVGVLLFLV